MKIGSLFAGIGGLELGLEWAGVGHTVWQVEREPFCRQVLARHWPDAQRFDDVTTVGAANLPQVEVICGGFPCQDISYAGKGAGLAGERSGLWYEFARIVRELRPRYVVVENVSALLTRGLDAVLGTLASLGYDAEWSCVRASDVGARHRRERVFVVAWRLDDADDARLEGRGVRGQRRSDERPAGAAGGEVMADARRCGIERRRADRDVAGASRAGEGDSAERQRDGHAAGGCGEAAGGVANAVQVGPGWVASDAGRDDADRPATGREESAGRVTECCAHDVAHSDDGRRERVGLGGLLDGERTERGHDADGCCGARHLGGDGRLEQVDQGGSQTQPRVGRAAHGLSARLDVARPGESQAEWEAPRVVTQAPYRADRLRALGNAVVPQVAELVGRRLMEIAGEQA